MFMGSNPISYYNNIAFMSLWIYIFFVIFTFELFYLKMNQRPNQSSFHINSSKQKAKCADLIY